MPESFWPAPPPTRILSWQQQVIEADPYWRRNFNQPWIYEFSNGRLFYRQLPVYQPPEE